MPQMSKATWDRRFLQLAETIAQWSKDPSTKVGAVIVRPNKTIVSLGYNGFPRGVRDTPVLYEDRAKKYPRIVHAEANAIVSSKTDLTGCTLYTYPLPVCSECMKLVIQSGITRCVSIALTPAEVERWAESLRVAREMADQANVEVAYLPKGK